MSSNFKRCNNCGINFHGVGEYCTNCGAKYAEVENRCTNPECPHKEKPVPLVVSFCNHCGMPTTEGRKRNAKL